MRGYKVRRIVFQEPEHLSPLVAELYRWWYKQRQLEPMWTLRTGSVPYWMKFNIEPSLHSVERYLDNGDPDDEIYMMQTKTAISHNRRGFQFRRLLRKDRTSNSAIENNK